MYSLMEEELSEQQNILSDTEIMFEFIKLRDHADKHLAASMRFAEIEEKLNHTHYEDAFYKLADIYFTLKNLSVLRASEIQYLTSLMKAIQNKALNV